jgi:hypothetical protein
MNEVNLQKKEFNKKVSKISLCVKLIKIQIWKYLKSKGKEGNSILLRNNKKIIDFSEKNKSENNNTYSLYLERIKERIKEEKEKQKKLNEKIFILNNNSIKEENILLLLNSVKEENQILQNNNNKKDKILNELSINLKNGSVFLNNMRNNVLLLSTELSVFLNLFICYLFIFLIY